MKQNLILFFLLVIALVVTFVFIELPERKNLERKYQLDSLFDTKNLGNLIALETDDLYLKLGDVQKVAKERDGEFFHADPIRVNALLSRLGLLDLVRLFTTEEVERIGEHHFFEHYNDHIEFHFENGSFSFYLGRRVKVDDTFYIKIDDGKKQTIALVRSKAARESAYQQGREALEISHRELRSFLQLNAHFFKDTAIFSPPLKMENIDVIGLESPFMRNFSIDVQNRQTNVPLYDFVSLKKSRIDEYLQALLQLRTEKIIFQANDLIEIDDSSTIIAITFLAKGYPLAKIKLIDRYQEREGAFLLVTRFDGQGAKVKLFEANQDIRDFLVINHQLFWDKRPLKGLPLKAQIAFQKGEWVSFEMRSRGRFEVHSQNSSHELSHQRFEELFSFLLSEADFVSALSAASFQNFIEESRFYRELLSLKINGELFQVVQTMREMIVLRQGSDRITKFHYLQGSDLPISVNERDYYIP